MSDERTRRRWLFGRDDLHQNTRTVVTRTSAGWSVAHYVWGGYGAGHVALAVRYVTDSEAAPRNLPEDFRGPGETPMESV